MADSTKRVVLAEASVLGPEISVPAAAGGETVASVKDVRARLADAANSNYERLEEFLARALDAEKLVWVECEKCHRKTQASVPDWHASLKVVEVMLNQGFGRPPQGDSEGERGFVLNRTVVNP